MPVQLQPIEQPGTAEVAALNKIYGNQPGREADASWFGARVQNGERCFGASFNGTIIAALWLRPGIKSWEITDITVRDITRRRGVARQMLALLIKMADAHETALLCNQCFAPLAEPLREFGFRATHNGWQR